MTEEESVVWYFASVKDSAHCEYQDGAVDHINAGDSLAQVATTDAVATLRAWGAKLRGGGTIRLRVPNFDAITKAYDNGEPETESLLLGSGNRSIWNREKLARCLNHAGFEVIGGARGTSWTEELHALSVTARKCMRPAPTLPMKDIQAIMSLPRLCWTDTQGELHQAAASLGINTTRSTGVFWGQCLERLIESKLSDPTCKYILTVDYDSVFDAADIVRLWQVMETNPDVAALCPLQIARDKETILVSALNPDGTLKREVRADAFHTDALDINTGHFGLTLIRCDAIRDLPRPLFLGRPNKDGNWGEGRVDDDIHFWYLLRDAKRRICVCPKVRIGHIQTIITWAGEDMKTVHQYCSKYHDEGRPPECMTY